VKNTKYDKTTLTSDNQLEHKARGKSNKLEEKKWCAKTKVMIKATSKQG